MRGLLLAVLLAACSSKEAPPPSYEPLGKKPANATRPTAPPGIEASALAVGAKAPDVSLGDWRLADALDKHARVMLVFYRGDW